MAHSLKLSISQASLRHTVNFVSYIGQKVSHKTRVKEINVTYQTCLLHSGSILASFWSCKGSTTRNKRRLVRTHVICNNAAICCTVKKNPNINEGKPTRAVGNSKSHPCLYHSCFSEHPHYLFPSSPESVILTVSSSIYNPRHSNYFKKMQKCNV